MSRVVVVDTLQTQVAVAGQLTSAASSITSLDVAHNGTMDTSLVGMTASSTMLSAQFAPNTINQWRTESSGLSIYLPTLSEFLLMQNGVLSAGGSISTWLFYVPGEAEPVGVRLVGSEGVRFSAGGSQTSMSLDMMQSLNIVVNYGVFQGSTEYTSPCVILNPALYYVNAVSPI